jgi:hypothetical protein
MVRPCRHRDLMCLLLLHGKEKKKRKMKCRSGSLTDNYSNNWWSSGLRIWLADDVRPLPVEFENGPLPRSCEQKSIFCAKGPQAAIATDLFARFCFVTLSSNHSQHPPLWHPLIFRSFLSLVPFFKFFLPYSCNFTLFIWSFLSCRRRFYYAVLQYSCDLRCTGREAGVVYSV